MARITFIDAEVDPGSGKVLDIGGVRWDGMCFHDSSLARFSAFLQGTEYVCGHNVLAHDMKYLGDAVRQAGVPEANVIDTLYLSPLLFPKRPYHALLKDDKLQTEELNNPLNDAKKAKILFDDEVAAFGALDENLREIYSALLSGRSEFRAFFSIFGGHASNAVRFGLWRVARAAAGLVSNPAVRLIRRRFESQICSHADLESIAAGYPVELAYCLALISALEEDGSDSSITPRWVLHNYPDVERIMFLLRSAPCAEGCPYCNKALDIHAGLKKWFGYDSFREYGGEPLQEKAVKAAVENRSLLAVFPTGGGKSLTFQLPALMAGRNTGGLTVVISPLQSLMKDQVDNLEKRGITDAVTINGLLDPIERAKSVERVEDGSATMLYISPESLRSKTIERLLLGRKIVRFVIDEAHCFSSWGQDFRVDYLYIAEFIRNLQRDKHLQDSIPVSCFTATAKVKVMEDIRSYFKNNLSLDLQLFTTGVARHNLHYRVIPEPGENEKYLALRRLIEERTCPVIVYVTRTRKAVSLAARLTQDGLDALPYHGKMTPEEKTANQDSFMSGKTRIIVATSAFGMGVDKSDVGLVVHYQISDSLENYVQEAGRAGRDERISADCYVLFNDEDLSGHFAMLNRTKLTIKEIQQVWRAVKEITRSRRKVSNSALEIARKAGWDDGMEDLETRVRTAIASLEQAGYLRRGQNMPRVYATGIRTKTAQEAIDRIEASSRFDEKEKKYAIRIIRMLISSRSVKKAQGEEAESRVDYISDRLGISREDVIHSVNLLREEGILADTKDITAYVGRDGSPSRSRTMLKKYNEVERFLLKQVDDRPRTLDYKELNELAEVSGCSSVRLDMMKVILNFWSIRKCVRKSPRDKNHVDVQCLIPMDEFERKVEMRQSLAAFIVEYLYERADEKGQVEFSVLGLKEACGQDIASFSSDVSAEDVEDALFYLSRIGAVSIEGGFMVIYNALTIERLEMDNHRRYKVDDYQKLSDFYKNKIEQIHIVGEYARKMIEDYDAALEFVDDYFKLNYPIFRNKYFKGREEEISRNITPEKFRQLFGELSARQLSIVKDRDAKYAVVAAGPGSGKTRVLVHKLASLLLMEDVKHEQLLMLTFSRAAATEFRQRLHDLIGNAVSFVDIKTFHSYCFDLLGRIGSLEKSQEIVKTAVERIRASEVDASRVTKTVLVIDEAQDMDEDEFGLVRALMERNEDMRILAVGDDDQNIYAFRGSSPKYMKAILDLEDARQYDLVQNFRSRSNLVEFSNKFAERITERIKNYPIDPVRRETGELELTEYSGENLAVPLVDSLLSKPLSGTVAVLTQKNDEALLVASLLRKSGVPARLVQSNDEVRLSSLAEIVRFKECAGFREEGAIISEDVWNAAVSSLKAEFSRSSMLQLCLDLLEAFASSCPEASDASHGRVIYKSDFDVFLSESAPSDFVRGDADTVVVSTIHKAKGKEFDNVFLLLENFTCEDDEKRRQLYVALTRAKDNLYIHVNSPLFDGLSVPGLVLRRDTASYGRPAELVVQLSMRDVYLEPFKRKPYAVSVLMSGNRLNVDVSSGPDIRLSDAQRRPVLVFSKRFKDRYDKLIRDGYHLSGAEVDMVIWWKDENMDEAVKVILPKLSFSL